MDVHRAILPGIQNRFNALTDRAFNAITLFFGGSQNENGPAVASLSGTVEWEINQGYTWVDYLSDLLNNFTRDHPLLNNLSRWIIIFFEMDNPEGHSTAVKQQEISPEIRHFKETGQDIGIYHLLWHQVKKPARIINTYRRIGFAFCQYIISPALPPLNFTVKYPFLIKNKIRGPS